MAGIDLPAFTLVSQVMYDMIIYEENNDNSDHGAASDCFKQVTRENKLKLGLDKM